MGFLVGLVTYGIVITPIVASLVMLIMMKRGGERRAIAKSHRNIVIAVVFLILAAGIFPPYWEAKFDTEGQLISRFTRWEFNKNIKGLIESITEDKPVEMIGYMPRRGILWIEIIGILTMAGAAYLTTKKRHES